MSLKEMKAMLYTDTLISILFTDVVEGNEGNVVQTHLYQFFLLMSLKEMKAMLHTSNYMREFHWIHV